MVSAYTRYNGTSEYTEFKGLANDPRPLNAKEGDFFQELDTDTTYRYDGRYWVLVPSYPLSNGSGASGLPSTTYYIMQVEPAGDDLADLTFCRPSDEERTNVMGATASVERDMETGAERLIFGEVTVNPEADPPVTDADIAAIELKLASWQNDSYGGNALRQSITELNAAEFYVYPYIL